MAGSGLVFRDGATTTGAASLDLTAVSHLGKGGLYDIFAGALGARPAVRRTSRRWTTAHSSTDTRSGQNMP